MQEKTAIQKDEEMEGTSSDQTAGDDVKRHCKAACGVD